MKNDSPVPPQAKKAAPSPKPDAPTRAKAAAPSPSGRKRAILLFVLALVVVSAAAWWFWQRTHPKPEGPLEMQGNVDIRQVSLGFRVGGRIQAVRVEEGDAVRAGDLLAQLDEGPYTDMVQLAQAQLASAEAALSKLLNGTRREEIDQARAQAAQAQASLVNARSTFERQRELRGRNVVAQADLDNAVAGRDSSSAQLASAQAALALLEAGARAEDIAAARAEVERNRANLAAAQRNLADCRILSPSDGVIITRAQEPGAIVASGAIACALNLHSPVWVRTYVGERDLGRVRPGMKAQVFTDTRPKEPIDAQVGFISPVAEFTPKAVETRELRSDLVYRLRVVVDKPDAFLRQGMPVTVRLAEEK